MNNHPAAIVRAAEPAPVINLNAPIFLAIAAASRGEGLPTRESIAASGSTMTEPFLAYFPTEQMRKDGTFYNLI